MLRPRAFLIAPVLITCLVVALLVGVVGTQPQVTDGELDVDTQPQAAEGDLDRLQGTWVCVGYDVDGREDAAGQSLAASLPTEYRFRGSECTCTWGVPGVGGGTKTGPVTLHSGSSPKGIDWVHEGDQDNWVTRLGIYDVEGDTLRLCWAFIGEGRLRHIKTSKGDGQPAVMLLRRRG